MLEHIASTSLDSPAGARLQSRSYFFDGFLGGHHSSCVAHACHHVLHVHQKRAKSLSYLNVRLQSRILEDVLSAPLCDSRERRSVLSYRCLTAIDDAYLRFCYPTRVLRPAGAVLTTWITHEP